MSFSDEIDQIFFNLGNSVDERFKGNRQNDPKGKDPYFVIKLFLLIMFLTALINIPVFIISGVFFGVFFFLKKKTLPYTLSFISFIGFVATIVTWGYRDFLQFFAIWRKMLPKVVGFAEAHLQKGIPFEVNRHTIVMTILLAITYAGISYYMFNRLKVNWFTYEKEEKEQQYLDSDKYKRIEKNMGKILQKTQQEYRKNNIHSNLYQNVLLGNDIHAKPVLFPIANFFTHTLVQGTTGTGKTYMLYNLMEAGLKEGLGALFVDGKGDPKTVREIKKLTEKYGKKLYVFSDKASDSPDGHLWNYNPVMYGKPTAITDRLMAVMDWSESFYENESKNMLQQIILFLQEYIEIEKTHEHRPVQGEPLAMNLETIHRFLDLPELANYLFNEQSEDIIVRNYVVPETTEGESTTTKATIVNPTEKKNTVYQKYIRMFFYRDDLDPEFIETLKEERSNQSKLIQGLRTQLEQLIYSDFGQRFTYKENHTLDIEKIIKDGDVVVFSLDSNNYNSFIPVIGRFIIADSAYVTTTLYGNTENFKGVLGIFDEFGAYGTDNILDILSRARSALFGAILGIQSISDLANKRRNIDIKEQTIDNCNLFILGRTNSDENAEKIVNIIGTHKDIDRTVMTENQLGSLTRFETKGERGTVRKVNKFNFSPDEIKELPNYQFYYLNKNLKENNRGKVFSRNVFEGL
ncbi:type IV secretory system conjugative DNA transfer family protein [Enterococcus sp. AZ103]|uniref:type IV secretory system conjugative DNA transfer family protein n=1 Tax=Enterococcus sp. AZ103 TaxID=2774628 RepID=UPI003F216218